MTQPVCYAVLNDYNRTANLKSPRSPAFMNGDTAVRSSLDVRVGLDEFQKWMYHDGHYFDIVEDNYVAEVSSEIDHQVFQNLAPENVDMMYTPLLSHLPALTKDPLILMAAYEGNLDRYIRLRRPRMLRREARAIIRGIYHNTTFAKYWSLQDVSQYKRGRDISRATIARFIMVNDLSHITPTTPNKEDMPGMIWWPLIPAEETLRELARRRPDMRVQVAMTCIESNNEQLWSELEPPPRCELWKIAQRRYITGSTQPWWSYFTDYLERREAENKERTVDVDGSGETRNFYGVTEGHDLAEDAAVVDKEPTSTYLRAELGLPMSGPENSSVYSHGMQPTAADWELFICSSEEMRQLARERDGFPVFWEDDYPLSLYPEYQESIRKFRERQKRERESKTSGEVNVDVDGKTDK